MAGKPARPSESTRPGEGEESDERTTPRQSASTTPGQSAENGEHADPIVAARLRKADGRALILYSAAGNRP